jgi:hypothetical protein
MRTQGFIAYTFAACLVSLMAGTAMADDGSGLFNAFLKGKYQFNINQSCTTSNNVEVPPGFNGVVSLGPGQTDPVYFTGVITYDGNGNATQTDHGIFLSGVPHGAGESPVDTFQEECHYTYKVARDGSFTQDGYCTGVGGGGSYKLSGDKWKGQIALGGLVLTMNQVGTDVSTLAMPAVPPTKSTQYRICGSVGTSVRLHPQ